LANPSCLAAKYYSFNLYNEDKVREKLTYMHENPVRAGLVTRPCDWAFSRRDTTSRAEAWACRFVGSRERRVPGLTIGNRGRVPLLGTSSAVAGRSGKAGGR